MADDYVKFHIKGVYSKSSDYSDPVTTFNPAAFTLTPHEYIHCEIEAATSAGTTLTTSIMDSATLLAVKNNDATNYVTATFDNLGMGGTDVSVRIAPGGFFVTTDFTAGQNLKLVANTSECECEVFVCATTA